VGVRTGRFRHDRPRRCAIAASIRIPQQYATHARDFTEAYPVEDPVLSAARAQAAELGLTCTGPGAGAVLRLVAAAGAAKAVVEIGTGAGVSGLWLLRGMRPDGILTTIDIEPEYQRVARRAFAEAGFAPSRTRIIAGRALDVLPRLADGGYDLVFVDHDVNEYAACAAAAARLLRPCGVLVLGGALAGGKVGDPAVRDPDTVALREVVKSLRDTEEWLPALLPTGSGLLCAARR
jgi:predicted O-methyltransferase YrrM